MKVIEKARIDNFVNGSVNLVRERFVIYDDPNTPDEQIQYEFRRSVSPGEFDSAREFIEFTGNCSVSNPEIETSTIAVKLSGISVNPIMAQIELHWTPDVIAAHESMKAKLDTEETVRIKAHLEAVDMMKISQSENMPIY